MAKKMSSAEVIQALEEMQKAFRAWDEEHQSPCDGMDAAGECFICESKEPAKKSLTKLIKQFSKIKDENN